MIEVCFMMMFLVMPDIKASLCILMIFVIIITSCSDIIDLFVAILTFWY